MHLPKGGICIIFKKTVIIHYYFSSSSDSIGSDTSSKNKNSSDQDLIYLKTQEAKDVNDDDFELLTQLQSDDEQILYIDSYLKRLFSENTVTDTAKLMELIVDNNINITKCFIDKIIIKERKNISIHFLNYSNFQDFSNILITISLNNNSIKKSFFDINFAIIYIAERTYYINNNTKMYLCMLLSKNELFSSRVFWTELIEKKVNKLILDNNLKPGTSAANVFKIENDD